MKQFILFLSFFTLSQLSIGQNCEKISPHKKGLTLEYAVYNKKGKETSREIATTKSVTTENGVMKIVIELKDSSKKSQARDFTLECKDGNFYIDMSSYMNYQNNTNKGDLEIKAEGNFIEFPTHIKTGDNLKNTTIKLSSDSVDFEIPFTVSNRVIENVGDFKIKAGSFSGYEVSFDYLFELGPIKFSGKGKEWYVNGIGIVKSESYSKKGNLRWSRELIKMQQE